MVHWSLSEHSLAFHTLTARIVPEASPESKLTEPIHAAAINLRKPHKQTHIKNAFATFLFRLGISKEHLSVFQLPKIRAEDFPGAAASRSRAKSHG